jgi:hypothetical protein
MNLIGTLKARIHPDEVIEYILKVKQDKTKNWRTCPICNSPSSFGILMDNKSIQCYNNSCKLNSYGTPGKPKDIIYLVQAADKASNTSQAIQLLTKFFADRNESSILPNITKPSIYEKAFKVYHKKAKGNSKIDHWIQQRNLSYSACMDYIGYAEQGCLQAEGGLSKNELASANLLAYNKEVFDNRVVFPIKDRYNVITHLQGRSLNSDDELRWLSVRNNDHGSISTQLFNLNSVANKKAAILCEGITDSLSLISLGLPAIGMLGNATDLSSLQKTSIKELLVILDIDRYAMGTPYEMEYKSWTSSFLNLAKLSKYMQINCVMLPNIVNLKDINDWLVLGVKPKEFTSYCRENMLSLFDFSIKYLINSSIPSVHKGIFNLLSNDNLPRYEKALSCYDKTWIDIYNLFA